MATEGENWTPEQLAATALTVAGPSAGFGTPTKSKVRTVRYSWKEERPVAGGIILIVIGFVYLWKPTLFRRGIWMKTSIAIRTLSEAGYIRYMRGLGIVLIIAGIALIATQALQHS